ncbi:MAG TPA: hypothetical protein PKC19_08715 [Roseiflexaceae bacterium]|nr:hypothetical protein [Roseiflexaceae bacterium]
MGYFSTSLGDRPAAPAAEPIIAPDGLCQCCTPPRPLVWRADALVCRMRPENHYHPANRQPIAPARAAETLAAIDAALRSNSALVTVNGLFDLE